MTIGFDIYNGKGFKIHFENGCTVSVQFGNGSYCSDPEFSETRQTHHCRNAEIAGFDAKGNWICLPEWKDDVSGWNSPAQVLEFMNYVAGLPAAEQ
jgi:hypothetical protein